ncbi:MAG: serine/threonine protein phosphatase [Caulobacterales bacterium]|nr:serine/threonine protein phosphatase [Caulobacterales bacterium]
MAEDRVFYAIGDVHGELELLAALHDAIFAHHGMCHGGLPATIVHLGDYVDRGPDSRGVVSRLMKLESQAARDESLDVVCLKGNHEQMMMDALAVGHGPAQSHWLQNGGEATAQSYLNEGGEIVIDRAHLDWMRALPSLFVEPERRLVFVHAGIAPAVFPGCPEEVRLWTRARAFFDDAAWPRRPELEGVMVVHGHTPTDTFRPDESPRRVNVDTGACFGGPLTAAVLAPRRPVEYLYARAR